MTAASVLVIPGSPTPQAIFIFHVKYEAGVCAIEDMFPATGYALKLQRKRVQNSP